MINVKPTASAENVKELFVFNYVVGNPSGSKRFVCYACCYWFHRIKKIVFANKVSFAIEKV